MKGGRDGGENDGFWRAEVALRGSSTPSTGGWFVVGGQEVSRKSLSLR